MSHILHFSPPLPIIGHHRSPLIQKFGTPRQPNLVGVSSRIEFVAPFDTPDAFVGIEQYSHLWVMWQFHHNKAQEHFRPQVRPPRLGGNDKMGVFATRSMYRPSQIGLSVVRLERVAVQDGKVVLHIVGADMIDGTPIVDIKPYLAYVDCVLDAKSGQIDKPMPKTVILSESATKQFQGFVDEQVIGGDDVAVIQALIAQDPRPAYRQNEVGTPFVMRYQTLDVSFVMRDDGVLMVDRVMSV